MPLISKPNLPHYPLIVDGAGFFGCTIATLFAEQYNRLALIVKKEIMRVEILGLRWMPKLELNYISMEVFYSMLLMRMFSAL